MWADLHMHSPCSTGQPPRGTRWLTGDVGTFPRHPSAVSTTFLSRSLSVASSPLPEAILVLTWHSWWHPAAGS